MPDIKDKKQENRQVEEVLWGSCGEKCGAKEGKELMFQYITIRENKKHMEERENLKD